MTKLAVIYGPPLVGKSAVAQVLARSLPGKTAVVSLAHLLHVAIVTPDSDAIDELEMVHIQLRLLVANYLKNHYHVVVEGQFIYEREGVLHNHEAEIGQLVALMRNLIDGSVIVRLTQPAAKFEERAAALGRGDGLASARRIDAAYRERSGQNFLNLDASLQDVDAIATQIRSALLPGDV